MLLAHPVAMSLGEGGAMPVMQRSRPMGPALEVQELGLATPRVDHTLQHTLALAVAWTGFPMATVGVVHGDGMFMAAVHGRKTWLFQTVGQDGAWCFCRHVVASQAALHVEDAWLHPLAASSWLVREEGVRAYAGVPLVSSQGNVLGTVAVMDTVAHDASQDVMDLLRDAADSVILHWEQPRH